MGEQHYFFFLFGYYKFLSIDFALFNFYRCKFGLVQEKNKTVEEKVRIRQEENLLRQMTKDNLARIERLREEKKERRRKNIQKQKEAELRSEVVQVVSEK